MKTKKTDRLSTSRTLKTGSQQVSRNKNARRSDSNPIQETNVGVLRCLMLGDGTKKERRTTAAPRTPTKGRVEQHLADAPFSGARVQALLLHVESLAAQVGRFRESRNSTLARRSIVLGDRYPAVVMLFVYLLAILEVREISHNL